MHSVDFIADRGTAEPVSAPAALFAGKKVAPDATLLLMQDHEEVLSFFAWCQSAQDNRTMCAVALKIVTALRAHMIVEEEILYPAARDALQDKSIVERSYAEHESAKQLMNEIERGLRRDEVSPQLVADLQSAIAQHVEEEEGELFPKLSNADLDLYALGRRVAAGRVKVLLTLTGKDRNALQEKPPMPITQNEALSLFVVGLRDAHAAARNGREMVERQIERVENFPNVKERLERHLPEKERQLARIEQILESLGEDRSTFKDIAMAMTGNVTAFMSSVAKDEILKNSLVNFGMANFMAASFESLITAGQVAGKDDEVKLLQECLNEERAMAAWLAENLRGVTLMHLQMRSEGVQASH